MKSNLLKLEIDNLPKYVFKMVILKWSRVMRGKCQNGRQKTFLQSTNLESLSK